MDKFQIKLLIEKQCSNFLSSEKMASNSIKSEMTREVVTYLYTAKLYLPGFFQRNAFLIIGLILPLVDMLTDYINAGYGVHRLLKDF